MSAQIIGIRKEIQAYTYNKDANCWIKIEGMRGSYVKSKKNSVFTTRCRIIIRGNSLCLCWLLFLCLCGCTARIENHTTVQTWPTDGQSVDSSVHHTEDTADGQAADDSADGQAADDSADRQVADDSADRQAADDSADRQAADDSGEKSFATLVLFDGGDNAETAARMICDKMMTKYYDISCASKEEVQAEVKKTDYLFLGTEHNGSAFVNNLQKYLLQEELQHKNIALFFLRSDEENIQTEQLLAEAYPGMHLLPSFSMDLQENMQEESGRMDGWLTTALTYDMIRRIVEE